MEKNICKIGLMDRVYLFNKDLYVATYKVTATHGDFMCMVECMEEYAKPPKYSFKVMRMVFNGSVKVANDLDLPKGYRFLHGEGAESEAKKWYSKSNTIKEAMNSYIQSYPSAESIEHLKEFLKKEMKPNQFKTLEDRGEEWI